jgi:hypothetical protein
MKSPRDGRVAGISQGIAQRGMGVLLHAAVGQANVAGIAVNGLRPTGKLAGNTLRIPFSAEQNCLHASSAMSMKVWYHGIILTQRRGENFSARPAFDFQETAQGASNFPRKDFIKM